MAQPVPQAREVQLERRALQALSCPALPGLVTDGDTLEEARVMAADAIRGYLACLRKDGVPLPVEAQRFIAEQIEGEIDAA